MKELGHKDRVLDYLKVDTDKEHEGFEDVVSANLGRTDNIQITIYISLARPIISNILLIKLLNCQCFCLFYIPI